MIGGGGGGGGEGPVVALGGGFEDGMSECGAAEPPPEKGLGFLRHRHGIPSHSLEARPGTGREAACLVPLARILYSAISVRIRYGDEPRYRFVPVEIGWLHKV